MRAHAGDHRHRLSLQRGADEDRNQPVMGDQGLDFAQRAAAICSAISATSSQRMLGGVLFGAQAVDACGSARRIVSGFFGIQIGVVERLFGRGDLALDPLDFARQAVEVALVLVGQLSSPAR